MRIHALSTGKVAVKARQRKGAGRGRLRLARTLLDRTWTEPLPIHAWAIEHPEGVIVVDTGETSRAGEPGYFPRWHPYFRLGLREWVEPDEEIGPQLERLGISTGDVARVVMTHLHTDHAGGLEHFPRSDILVSAAELATSAGFRGRVRGYANRRFPEWFEPRPVPFRPDAFGPFHESFVLTDAGDVRLVPLPGHTPGQLGVIVHEEERVVLLAGDASYTQELMLRGAVDGVAPDAATARRTLDQVRELAALVPTVYLPTHDPGSAARLAEREPALAVARTPARAGG